MTFYVPSYFASMIALTAASVAGYRRFKEPFAQDDLARKSVCEANAFDFAVFAAFASYGSLITYAMASANTPLDVLSLSAALSIPPVIMCMPFNNRVETSGMGKAFPL